MNLRSRVGSVHHSWPPPGSRHFNGIETMARRARGESAQTDVLILLFRRLVD